MPPAASRGHHVFTSVWAQVHHAARCERLQLALGWGLHTVVLSLVHHTPREKEREREHTKQTGAGTQTAPGRPARRGNQGVCVCVCWLAALAPRTPPIVMCARRAAFKNLQCTNARVQPPPLPVPRRRGRGMNVPCSRS
jgi:hypothetical protein